MTEITRIDGLRSETFLYCVGVPAVYLAPGEHLLEVRAKWSRHIRGNRFKGFDAGPQYINVEVGHGEFWSLEYRIKEKRFIFTKCNPNKMYKYAKLINSIIKELLRKKFITKRRKNEIKRGKYNYKE